MTDTDRSDFSAPQPVRDARFRTAMTVSCRDCADIPKRPDAGRILIEDGVRIQVMHNGVRVLAGGYGAAWTEEIIQRLRGHHEPQEELAFHRIMQRLPREATMIELGGNWAYYSLWFLNDAPEARRAIVVEPDPNALEVGRNNAALNGRTMEFLQASVGERASPPRPYRTETAGLQTVPQVTIPDLFTTFAIDRLDILHCDAQGAELGVIRSSLDLMRRGRIRFGVFSTHAAQFSGDWLTHQRCLALVQGAGGTIVAEHDVHESFSGDGLIVAQFAGEVADQSLVPVSYNRYSRSPFRNPLFDLDEAFRSATVAETEAGRLAGELALRDRQIADGERERLRAQLEDARGALALAEAELAQKLREREEMEAELIQMRLGHQRDLAAAEAKQRQLAAQIDRWWASADRALRELAKLRATWSWRLTKPFSRSRPNRRSIRKRFRPGRRAVAAAGSSAPRKTLSTGLSSGMDLRRFSAGSAARLRSGFVAGAGCRRCRRQRGVRRRPHCSLGYPSRPN
jgi:FkbM family methyltransferase